MSQSRKEKPIPITEALELRGRIQVGGLESWVNTLMRSAGSPMGSASSSPEFVPLRAIMYGEAKYWDPSFYGHRKKETYTAEDEAKQITPFKNFFTLRGWEDGFINFLTFPIQLLFKPITTGLEFGLRAGGSALSNLTRFCYNQTKESRVWWAAFIPAALLAWPVGQAFNVLGKTFGYARRTVSSACNLVSSFLAATVGDFFRLVTNRKLKYWNAEENEESYPGFFKCVGSLIYNGLLLAVNTAVLAITLKTAGLLPAAASAVAPALSGLHAAATSSAAFQATATFLKTASTVAQAFIAYTAPMITQGITGAFNFAVVKGIIPLKNWLGNKVVDPIKNRIGDKLGSIKDWISDRFYGRARTNSPQGNPRRNRSTASPATSPRKESKEEDNGPAPYLGGAITSEYDPKVVVPASPFIEPRLEEIKSAPVASSGCPIRALTDAGVITKENLSVSPKAPTPRGSISPEGSGSPIRRESLSASPNFWKSPSPRSDSSTSTPGSPVNASRRPRSHSEPNLQRNHKR